jgi:hypothetical protein
MYSLNKNENTWVVYLSKTLEWKCKYPACLYVKDHWIKMQIPGFPICQRLAGLITWVYPSGFLPKNHVIYLGKSDFQTHAPIILAITMFLEPQLGRFFKMWKCKYPDPGSPFQKKKALMPGPGWYMKIKYPPTQHWLVPTCGVPMGEEYHSWPSFLDGAKVGAGSLWPHNPVYLLLHNMWELERIFTWSILICTVWLYLLHNLVRQLWMSQIQN